MAQTTEAVAEQVTAHQPPDPDRVPLTPRVDDLLAMDLGMVHELAAALPRGEQILLINSLDELQTRVYERKRALREALATALSYQNNGAKALAMDEVTDSFGQRLKVKATWKPQTPDRSSSATLAKPQMVDRFNAALRAVKQEALFGEHFDVRFKVKHYSRADAVFRPLGGDVAEAWELLFDEKQRPGELEIEVTPVTEG